MILRGIIMAEERLSQKTGIKEQVIQEIIQLAKENQVEKVILFGSRARGDFKERSDIWINRFKKNCWRQSGGKGFCCMKKYENFKNRI